MIIVDTSGRHMQEQALFDEMKQVNEAVKPDEVIFVMDSSIGQACFEQASAFKKAVKVGSVIITKLDYNAKGGGALSAVAATEAPITFIGLGEHFNDFEQFEPESFVNRLLGLGDLKKLFSVIQDIVPESEQEVLIEKIAKGNFTLRDL
jgi:signal recognition particle subunit SRP54